MKKALFALVLATLAAAVSFANGNTERLSWIEGEAVTIPGEAGLALRLEDGTLVRIRADSGELKRLAVRERERIKVKGVFIGGTGDPENQERIFARQMNIRGKSVTLENPEQLQERDRIQLREYEAEMLQTRTRDQERDGTGSGTAGNPTPNSGTGGSQNGAKSEAAGGKR